MYYFIDKFSVLLMNRLKIIGFCGIESLGHIPVLTKISSHFWNGYFHYHTFDVVTTLLLLVAVILNKST